MDFMNKFKNIMQVYINMIKKYAIAAGVSAFGGILLILVMAGGMSGGDESMDGTGSTSGTVNSGGMRSATIGSGSVGSGSVRILTEPSMGRDEFIDIVANYQSDEGYLQRFGQYAETIYDMCTERGINPVICVAQAMNESNFGKSTPSNSPWNYWGLGVANDTNVGIEYGGFENALNRILQFYIKICE